MGMAIAFDTHEFVKTLESSGIPTPQAEAISEAVRRAQSVTDAALEARDRTIAALESKVSTFDTLSKRGAEQTATKGDLRELRTELKGDIALVRKDTDALRADMHAGFALIRKDLIIKLGSMLIVGFGTVIGIQFQLMG